MYSCNQGTASLVSIYIIIFTAAASSYVTIEIKAMYIVYCIPHCHHFSSIINYTLLTLKCDLNRLLSFDVKCSYRELDTGMWVHGML